jgi:hypothetical protein
MIIYPVVAILLGCHLAAIRTLKVKEFRFKGYFIRKVMLVIMSSYIIETPFRCHFNWMGFTFDSM